MLHVGDGYSKWNKVVIDTPLQILRVAAIVNWCNNHPSKNKYFGLTHMLTSKHSYTTQYSSSWWFENKEDALLFTLKWVNQNTG